MLKTSGINETQNQFKTTSIIELIMDNYLPRMEELKNNLHTQH